MDIQFLLNGETVTVTGAKPTTTLLDYLRETRGLTGTKEGCAEGDCGACTVLVTDDHGAKALNACILFLPQLAGKSLRTVEGVGDGSLHPVQTAMIDNHASQCGFCTPGFVMSLVTSHIQGRKDFDDVLAGNLCRCTGYAPIIKAADASANAPLPRWHASDEEKRSRLDAGTFESLDEFANWYAAHPKATLIAGATDVGLWVTKSLRELDTVAFIGGIKELQSIVKSQDGLTIGAAVTLSRLRKEIAVIHPHFVEMIRRFGSSQVRAAATLGGNIANGSPIGDSPPALIALGARLILRKGSERRELPLEEFFIDYGKQNRAAGEFVESIFIPAQDDRLKCYKISKRFDQDISALCGCFNIHIQDGHVACCAIAFGGMAGIPKRAYAVEKSLLGQAWTRQTIDAALSSFADDFSPLSDMRASADYRLETAQNLLVRYFEEDQGTPVSVLEAAP